MENEKASGYLSIVLHGHLPFVRHPEHPVFLEENWLFEAMHECYIPLLRMMDRLASDGVEFRLTLSLSPTLCEMLADELLMERFDRHVDNLVSLCEKEILRTEDNEDLNRLARMYHERFVATREHFNNVYARNLIGAFRYHQDSGGLEIITCAATHAFLPLVRSPRCVRAQIRMGANSYRRHFERDPAGIWLPECAYVHGLDQELAAEGIRYFFLDSHGLLFGVPRPKYGNFAPVYCRTNVAAFARDIESSKQVWSAETGYPGDPDYREFYRDLGYDAEEEYIAPHIHPDGFRHDIG
ncbi:MAG: DUF1957 domain-containing protein, partial [Planctomycetes bacterium]|nr:DUF1957 domain-containing protein [Planctomycetota bacterium]